MHPESSSSGELEAAGPGYDRDLLGVVDRRDNIAFFCRSL
jgi:hypothetical protein